MDRKKGPRLTTAAHHSRFCRAKLAEDAPGCAPPRTPRLPIGDEAWDVDYFLHENPELKRFAYCWFTDFVGWLPMPDGGGRE